MAKTVKDVSSHEFVRNYAAHLKRSGKVRNLFTFPVSLPLDATCLLVQFPFLSMQFNAMQCNLLGFGGRALVGPGWRRGVARGWQFASATWNSGCERFQFRGLAQRARRAGLGLGFQVASVMLGHWGADRELHGRWWLGI